MTDHEIECCANRGKRYRIRFNEKAEVISVENLYSRGYIGHATQVRRRLWTFTAGEMSTTVCCAIRAAQDTPAYRERFGSPSP